MVARFLKVILVASAVGGAACGGGGAAVAPAETPTVTPPSPPASPPPAPSPDIVSISTAGARFSPATVTISPGGSVTWQIVETTHNITFGGVKPPAGDAPDTPAGNSITRAFPAAGVYDYQCTRHSGMTGRVVVQDASAPVSPPPPPAPAPSAVSVIVTTNAYSPEEVEVPPGTTITWEFTALNDVVFDDQRPTGGDIADTPPGGRVSRTFSARGDYDYHSSHSREAKGRIRIR